LQATLGMHPTPSAKPCAGLVVPTCRSPKSKPGPALYGSRQPSGICSVLVGGVGEGGQYHGNRTLSALAVLAVGRQERDGEAEREDAAGNDRALRARVSPHFGPPSRLPFPVIAKCLGEWVCGEWIDHCGPPWCRGLGPGLPMRRGSVPADSAEAPTRRYKLGTKGRSGRCPCTP
jgi:hypothetical protein